MVGEVGMGEVTFEDSVTLCSSELILQVTYTVAKFRVTAWRGGLGRLVTDGPLLKTPYQLVHTLNLVTVSQLTAIPLPLPAAVRYWVTLTSLRGR